MVGNLVNTQSPLLLENCRKPETRSGEIHSMGIYNSILAYHRCTTVCMHEAQGEGRHTNQCIHCATTFSFPRARPT